MRRRRRRRFSRYGVQLAILPKTHARSPRSTGERHASVHLAAHDDLGRERLRRYLARPAFSHARLGVRRDGLVVYRVKNAGRGRVKQRVMTPVECLARLAAMVPPPRYPLVRLHGVLAPRHAWRALVVPRPPESYAGCMKSSRNNEACGDDEPRRRRAAPAARVAARGRTELRACGAVQRTDRGDRADLVARRDRGRIEGGAEHPLHRPLGKASWWRALRAALTSRLGDVVAPHLRRRRQTLLQLRRPDDRARRRDGHVVHRQAPRCATSLARPTVAA